MALELDTAPTIYPAAACAPPASSSAVRQRRGWLRRMYTHVEGAAQQGTAPRAGVAAEEEEEQEEKGKGNEKPRRRGWLRRLVSREYDALRRRWKLTSRLAAGLRWKRVSSSGLSVGGGGGCASALLDTVAFRVMYVVEAVVLGLALSCFFCCCGCQI